MKLSGCSYGLNIQVEVDIAKDKWCIPLKPGNLIGHSTILSRGIPTTSNSDKGIMMSEEPGSTSACLNSTHGHKLSHKVACCGN